MGNRNAWSRNQLLVAFNLYCQMPFGKLHSRNPEIIRASELIERTPSALAMKLTNIASLDPAITETGRSGLKGASAADREMWREMQNDWEGFAIESHEAMKKLGLESYVEREVSKEIAYIEDQIDYAGKDKTVVVKARVGQGFFRKAVLSAHNYRCCISGLSVQSLLVASHIIPWRADEANRLNPHNGLSLSMLHDKAFDIGIITINEDMTLRVSKKLSISNDDFFAAALSRFDGESIALPEKFLPDPVFLEYHRDKIFEKREVI